MPVLKLVQSACNFRYYRDFAGLEAAHRQIVDALPDYENRKQEKTMWRVDLPFHELLVSVGERYFNHDALKTIRQDGRPRFWGDAYKRYNKFNAFKEASKVYLLMSTKTRMALLQAWIYSLAG